MPVKIALAGNPNVGKSTVFNALTKLRHHTGNWAGKTVSNAVGKCKHDGVDYEIFDLPGTYSLFGESEDERAACEFLKTGEYDAVIAVCDATALERNLLLLLQITSVTNRVVMCLNLMDEAERAGMKIDVPALEKALGVPVVSACARDGKGVFEALTAAGKTDIVPFKSENVQMDSARIARLAVKMECVRSEAADKILTGKYTAVPLMLVLLGAILWITVRGANVPSAFLEGALTHLNGKIRALSEDFLPPIFVSAVCDGVLGILFKIVAVMLPPMAIFFPLFTFLEDLGLLPRIAFNLDRAFQKCRTCGKQALTMCMGFGCNCVGVTGCKIISSKRERLIAIVTNSLTPCNGRFPALIAVITIFFAQNRLLGTIILTAAIGFSVLVTLFCSFVLSKTVYPGEPEPFTLELPPLRRPQIGKILVRSVLDRSVFVLGRAVCAAAPSGLIIWLAANIEISGVSLLSHIVAFFDPLGHFMGLDGCILAAFILGFSANETVIPIMLMTYLGAGVPVETPGFSALRSLLAANGWGAETAVCMIIFTMFHFPCLTTLMTIKKETDSVSATAISFAVPTIIGFLLCAVVAHVI